MNIPLPFFASFFILLLAMASGHGNVALLALPLLVYGALVSYPTGEAPQVRAERALSHVLLQEGEDLTVTLSVVSEEKRPMRVLVEDVLPAGTEVCEGRNWRFLVLEPGVTVRWSYKLKSRRGHKTFDVVRISRLLTGSGQKSSRDAPLTNRVWVSPKPLFQASVVVRANTTLFQSGLNPSRRKGAGLEFFEVREMQFGDTPRSINWRVSSRSEENLFLNEYESENQANALIVLDSRQASVSPRVHEHAVAAAATLTQTLLGLGNRVGMLTLGGGIDWIPFGRGRYHLAKISRCLAETEPGHNYAIRGFNHVPPLLLRRRCLLFLVSPLLERDVPHLVSWSMRGHRLLLLSPNYLAIESRELKLLSSEHSRLASERQGWLATLRSNGVGVVDWDPASLDFLAVLHMFREYSRKSSWEGA